ncbi:hypothetical protein [Streptomyces sp. S1D4-20]|uniref:hypothetical protein n=1 Tax=Streptomyces sp. S1D4-20 TaxID=2594462 RepID=UPI001966D867|nr:hypothetical protein [Streptomyces sp. S1D4-20]
MSAELGQLFDAAVERIRAARPLASDSARTPELITSALGILTELTAYTRELNWGRKAGKPPTAMATATADLRSHLTGATGHLRTADRITPAATPETPSLLDEARAALAASRDLLHTHRGPDRQLLTPYALLLARTGSQHYLTLRIADVTWELGRLAADLAEGSTSPHLAETLHLARHELDQATVLGRAAAQDARHETGSLPAAPSTHPIPLTPDEAPARALTHLEDASEQLLRVSFEAARTTPGEPRLTGSDLPHLARSLALTRLLSAHLLQHATANTPGADTTLLDHLQTAARHWHGVAEAWHHLVDLDDPSAHPLLPPYDFGTRHLGQATPLPLPPAPHIACNIATTLMLRTGRLLHGPDWNPHTPCPARPPRSPDGLVESTGGMGPLLHALYRMSVAGRALAASIPALVGKAGDNLVTDSIEHRPPGLPADIRFYPAHHRQIERINDRYRTAGTAEDILCTSLLHHAQEAGWPIARARLDAAITELYPPAKPALSRQQEKILERIIADSQIRTDRFASAVRRAVHPPEGPPVLPPHNHDSTYAPHSPRP